jgi:hypothetical protein
MGCRGQTAAAATGAAAAAAAQASQLRRAHLERRQLRRPPPQHALAPCDALALKPQVALAELGARTGNKRLELIQPVVLVHGSSQLAATCDHGASLSAVGLSNNLVCVTMSKRWQLYKTSTTRSGARAQAFIFSREEAWPLALQ